MHYSRRKQEERLQRISSLPSAYTTPFTAEDRSTLAKPIEDLVQDVHKGFAKPVDILRSYGKAAIAVHQKTNCVTEILFPKAEEWAHLEIDTKGDSPVLGLQIEHILRYHRTSRWNSSLTQGLDCRWRIRFLRRILEVHWETLS
jgi:hypothetical protein